MDKMKKVKSVVLGFVQLIRAVEWELDCNENL